MWRGELKKFRVGRINFACEGASSEYFKFFIFKHFVKLGADGVPTITVIDASGDGGYDIRQA